VRYALKTKASNLSGDNPSVMTFNTLTETETPIQQGINAARLYAYHTILQAYGVISQSSVLNVTVKPNIAGLPTLASSVPIDVAAYKGWLEDWNLLADRPPLFSSPVDTNIQPGVAFGNAVYGPIGSSIMVTESSGGKTGRCFIPSPQIINVCDFGTGRIRGDYQQAIAYAHSWVCFIQETDPDNIANNAFGVFSTAAGAASRITKVTCKSEFSNLASRRR
jgi:hypothetical protein